MKTPKISQTAVYALPGATEESGWIIVVGSDDTPLPDAIKAEYEGLGDRSYALHEHMTEHFRAWLGVQSRKS